mmetsp:Transcript_7063/g.14937  ORF Transcript_7063/g.14937 Transcript_7063/m.14937 type:complete len:222 (-) Transcript_7063:721-1386(-)
MSGRPLAIRTRSQFPFGLLPFIYRVRPLSVCLVTSVVLLITEQAIRLMKAFMPRSLKYSSYSPLKSSFTIRVQSPERSTCGADTAHRLCLLASLELEGLRIGSNWFFWYGSKFSEVAPKKDDRRSSVSIRELVTDTSVLPLGVILLLISSAMRSFSPGVVFESGSCLSVSVAIKSRLPLANSEVGSPSPFTGSGLSVSEWSSCATEASISKSHAKGFSSAP